MVKFDDSLDELFEFEDRPHFGPGLVGDAAVFTGVNFINPQGRRRPLMRKRPQTLEERYAPVKDESSAHIDTCQMEAELVGGDLSISRELGRGDDPRSTGPPKNCDGCASGNL